MVLDHLNISKSQLWLDMDLAHLNISTLTTDGSLAGHFKVFLISCKVNGLSHRTISDYAQKIGAFVAFCNLQGATDPQEITVNHVRIFILSLQERIKAVSVHDYYREVQNVMLSSGCTKPEYCHRRAITTPTR